MHLHGTTRTLTRRQIGVSTLSGRGAAPRAVFAAEKHHAETRAASHSCQTGSAVIASGIVAGRCRTAHRAIECLGLHQSILAVALSVQYGSDPDAETRGRGDTETRRHGDAETWRHGDAVTRRHGDAGSQGRGDAKTRRRGDAETTKARIYCGTETLYRDC